MGHIQPFAKESPMIVLILLATSLFGLFIGHVCGFGLRTRHVQLHVEPQTSRDLRDRWSVGLWETHSIDR
jgi:hypothetical protein